MSQGLQLDAAYTVGKAIDLSSKHDAAQYFEALNGRPQRGLADFDVRHKLAITALWNLPTPHSGSSLLNNLLGGWEITGLTTLQSGLPFTVTCGAGFSPVFDKPATDPTRKVIGNTGCDYNADGTNLDVPNTPSFGNSRNSLSRSDFLKGIFPCSGKVPHCSDVFPDPALGQQGNLGRNTFHGPGYAGTNFSLIKNSKIPWFIGHEGANFQFRTEVFNLFNRVNLTGVQGDISNSLVGHATSTYGARDIQFAVKFAF